MSAQATPGSRLLGLKSLWAECLKSAGRWGSALSHYWEKYSGWAGLALIAVLLIAGSFGRWFESYELQSYDWRCRHQPSAGRDRSIVIIEIGEDALKTIGRWPFDRAYHAALFDILAQYGAKLVGVDILFAEPSSSDSGVVEAARAQGHVLFCEALKDPHPAGNQKVVASGVEVPLLDDFKAAAVGVGHVNAHVDRDGIRRRVAPIVETPQGRRFHLGFLMALKELGIAEETVTVDRWGWIHFGDKGRLPLDEDGLFLIRFSGKWQQGFEHVSYMQILASFKEILDGKKPSWDPEILRNKVCFLGLTAAGTHDINPIPIDPLYPQVGMHAEVFRNAMDGKYIFRVSRWWNLAVLILGVAAAAGISRIAHLSASVLAALGFWVFFAGAVILLFLWGSIWIDFVYPSLVFLLVYAGSILKRTMTEKKKREMLETELSIASRIQRSFLPSSLPEFSWLEVDVFMRPAKHVGGDLYDTLKLDGDRLALMCGDVSGKGMPAALFMAKSVAEFKFHASGKSDPAEALTKLNDNLSATETSGLFVTMDYAIFLPEEKRMLLTSGGHNPVIRVRSGGEIEYLNPDGGMPIGLMTGVEFGLLKSDAVPGDVFLFYSDGISEARNRKGNDFEMENLAKSAQAVRQLSAAQIKDAVVKDVLAFVGTAPQHDDMTLLIVKIR